MRIQHNIMAMNAYRNYNTNTSALSKNLEKLASGYKINRAGDDAAGLAISEKMRAQITGLNAAQKNVKDGISLVKTAEGAMQEIQDMLNRMDYLATQSANGTYDNEVDRANLQKEVDQLKSEINRIADSSNFNGIKLLDGSLSGAAKAGAVDLGDNWTDLSATNTTGAGLDAGLVRTGDGTPTKTSNKGRYELDLNAAKWTSTTGGGAATVSVTFAGVTATVTAADKGLTVTGEDLIKEWIKKADADNDGVITIGNKDFKVTQEGSKLILTGKDTTEFDGTQPELKFESAGTNMKMDVSQTGSATNSSSGIDSGNQYWATAVTGQNAVDAASQLAGKASFSFVADDIKDGLTIKIGDSTYTFAVGKDSKFKGKEGVIDMTDFKEGATDIEKAAAMRLANAAKGNGAAYVTADTTSGTVYIDEKLGSLDRSKWDVVGEDAKDGKDAEWTNADGESFVRFGTADPSMLKDSTASVGGLQLQIGDTSDDFNKLNVIVGDMHTDALGIGSLNIGTPESASAAIQTIKDAINQVSSVRGDLGATQNRLEHTANNLSVMAENIQDAESTIRDTDVAEEMMAYTKNNILIQSAQAMLAQANAVPQGVLQLLG